MPVYLDTSAFIKLVRSEPESLSLREALREHEADLISSILLSVEGRRAARRYGEVAFRRANTALTAVTLLALDQAIIDLAGELEPLELRSLDALHLATMLSLGGDVEIVYCYDSRLADAARAVQIAVAAPG